MERTSEFRRHRNFVKREHVKNIVKNIWLEHSLANDEKFIGKMAITPQPCNCKICCNTRRLKIKSKRNGLTKQEKISNYDLKDLKFNQ